MTLLAAISSLVCAQLSIMGVPDAGFLEHPTRVTVTRVGATTSPLTVRLSHATASGGFSDGPHWTRVWSPTFPLTIPAGAASAVAWFRAGVEGPDEIFADAGTQSALQPLFIGSRVVQDDFETGGVDLEQGWGINAMMPSTVIASDAGAHRGLYGMRTIDVDSAGGAANQAYADAIGLFSSPPRTYLRTWQRVGVPQGAGHIYLAQFVTTGGAYAQWGVRLPSGQPTFGGRDRTGAFTFFDVDAGPLTPGTWHLLEIAVEGVGGVARRRLFVDGLLAFDEPGVDYTGERYEGLEIGEPYSDDRAITLVIDYDDVRIAAAPQASTLQLSIGSSPVAGDCVPATVSLHDSIDGGLAAAPYEVDVAIVGAVVCAPLLIAEGDDQVIGGVRFSAPGLITVTATHVDFISGSMQITVLDGGGSDGGRPDSGTGPDGGNSDAGRTPGPTAVAIGCGCQTGVSPLVLLLALTLRRRRAPAVGRARTMPAVA